MKLTEHIAQRLTNLGVDCSVVGDEIHVDRTPRPVKIRISAGFEDSFESYNRARSISFDEPTRVLTHNNSVEFLLTHISIGGLGPMEEYVLSDSKSNSVCVGPATNEFSFAFFDSKAYEDFFDKRVRKRILETNIFNRSVEQILWTPRTARYNHKGKKTPPDLQQKAVVAIKSSLFKISVELHDCWSIWKPRKPRNVSAIYDSPADALSIPPAIYDENVVSYYMVAKASPFPSQSFLAYYHVLEYYFLKVSELILHDRLTAVLNDTRTSNRSVVEKVISTVRGQDSRSDETELLRSVLDRFVSESDLIVFIENFEKDRIEKIYSKKRQIFGEQLQVSTLKDHAMANSAKVIKHIRNAIVHSSDRYKREDRHIPLSETEELIEDFIPLIRFLAEKIIFGNAK